MKDEHKGTAPPVFPQRIRTYLTLNLALAVLMAIVIAVRMEQKTGGHLVIDLILFGLYTLMLASVCFGPFCVVELYLYRQKKGAWYAWRNQPRRSRRDRTAIAAERVFWKSEALRARLASGVEVFPSERNRTGLFADNETAEPFTRAALLLMVADKFERSGKREAAERCYKQITERFADSPEAHEVARRLSSLAKS